MSLLEPSLPKEFVFEPHGNTKGIKRMPSRDVTPYLYIIVCGDPTNGFWYMGPFKSNAIAQQHGKAHMRPENHWWVDELLTPDKKEGRVG